MKPVFKTHQWWLLTALPLLTALMVLYLYLHQRIPGEERVELTDKEKSQINALVTDTTSETLTNQHITHAVVFIRSHYRLSKGSEGEITDFMKVFRRPQDLLEGLNEFPIRVRSYFWLTRDWLYAEILFWTLFGVVASLLYNVSEAIRKGENNFNQNEIPTHIAKLFYAPLCTMIIYLAINLLDSDNAVQHMEFSAGQIVLAFILGFFSGRTIELLTRIKDVLLPLGKTELEDGQVAPDNKPPTAPASPVPPTQEVVEEAIERKGEQWKRLYPNVIDLNSFASQQNGTAGIRFGVFPVPPANGNSIPASLTYVAADGKTYLIPTDVQVVQA